MVRPLTHKTHQMLANRGELNGKRLLGPKTVELMSSAFVPDTLFQASRRTSSNRIVSASGRQISGLGVTFHIRFLI